MWNWIWHRHNRLEPKYSLIVTVHDSPLIRSFSPGILNIVESLAISLPYIDLHIFQRFTSSVFDGAEDETGFAIGIMGDLRAIGFYLSFVGVEGTEDSAFGARRRFRVINAIDEDGEAEDIGEEDKFLALRDEW